MKPIKTKTAMEVMLPKEQEQEADDLTRTIMEKLDQRERQRMADFMRGVQFAWEWSTTRDAGLPGA